MQEANIRRCLSVVFPGLGTGNNVVQFNASHQLPDMICAIQSKNLLRIRVSFRNKCVNITYEYI